MVPKEDQAAMIDPRTQEPVTSPSDCHLIPECFGVSELTVPLDGPFDHKIGEQCDAQLKLLLDSFFGQELRGRAAFEGGSQKLAGSFDLDAQRLRIPQNLPQKAHRRSRWSPFEMFRKALGMSETGEVRFSGFVGITIDVLRARLSMVNSAFLALHYLGRQEVYGPAFDQARVLLQKCVERRLESSDLDLVMANTRVYLLPDRKKLQAERDAGRTSIPIGDFRKYRATDPADVADGILDGFPKNCVTESGDSVSVRLPYAMDLRGEVRFPFASSTQTG